MDVSEPQRLKTQTISSDISGSADMKRELFVTGGPFVIVKQFPETTFSNKGRTVRGRGFAIQHSVGLSYRHVLTRHILMVPSQKTKY